MSYAFPQEKHLLCTAKTRLTHQFGVLMARLPLLWRCCCSSFACVYLVRASCGLQTECSSNSGQNHVELQRAKPVLSLIAPCHQSAADAAPGMRMRLNEQAALLGVQGDSTAPLQWG